MDGIYRLSPGHILTIEHGKINIKKFWDIAMNPDYSKNEDFFTHRLQKIFEESVKLRLMSDVPLGATLSGGLDSSAVVAVMSKFVEEPLKTFTVGFGEPTDEFKYAGIIAEHFETYHHEKIIQLNDAMDILPKMIWHQEDISNIGNEIPTYFFSELASKYVKVFLLGEGSDELFAGYNMHRMFSSSKDCYHWSSDIIHNSQFSNKIKDFLKWSYFYGYSKLPLSVKLNLFSRASSWLPKEQRVKLFSDNFLHSSDGVDPYEKYFITPLNSQINKSPFNALIRIGIKNTIPEFHCVRIDKLAMAHSLEGRVPFLDHRLVEFSCILPPFYKIHNLKYKYIFQKYLKQVLPKEIVNRKKQGLQTPLRNWFDISLYDITQQILWEKDVKKRGWYNYSYIEKMVNKRKNTFRKGKISRQLFILLLIEIWYKIFIENDRIDYRKVSL